jgi:sugar lactone lactonase YvrE
VKFTAMSSASQIFRGIFSRRFACLMGLAVLCAVALPAQVSFQGAQQTVLGTGLSGPLGTAVDSSGNLYIADTGHNRILKIAPNGTQTPVSVTGVTLSGPLAVALDALGNLYATDNASGGRVVKVPAGGGAATSFATVLTARGLTVDANGNVFVADEEDGTIVKITSGGVKTTFETGLEDPVDVAVDAAGNVYLADGSLSSIVKFPAAGGDGTNVGTSLGGVSGVAVDRSGNVYVAESGEGAAIVEITPLAVETTLTTNVNAANYIAVDSNYDLFIADSISNDVIEFSTISVPLGYANVCQSGAPTPCSQTATLQFSVTEAAISSVNVLTTGDSGLDFSETDGSCNGETSPCQVIVSFQPTAPGMRTGAVEILDECLGEVLAVPLYGTGSAAEAAFIPELASGPIGNDGFSDPVALAVAGKGVFGGGPIFIADDEACVIWISQEEEGFGIYAGNFTCGYAGDGGTATGTGELNSPEDVALDGAGNLYIADTGNAVIRKVDMNGTITTVAGNNERARTFFGDGGPATNAGLNEPNGIALDSAGNLYIADTNNNRIRKVDLAGIITTVAGTGVAGFSGDGLAAKSAQLNQPFGVRADAAGNLFIADSSNNVIRKLDLTGTISTVAGHFTGSEGSSGDGGPATSALLAFPIFVSVDAAGELYISDDDNNVIRQVDGAGTITTYAIPTDFPEELVVDPTGNLAVIDPTDEAMLLFVRTIPIGLTFGPQNINTASAPQDVTVTNIGNEPLNFTAITPPTGFNLSGPDTSCSASSLGVGLGCILGVVFDPTTATGYEDAVVLTDNNLGPAGATQSVSVTGTGLAPLTSTTTALVTSASAAFTGQSVMLTATVTPTPTGTLGNVDFCLGGTGPGALRSSRQTQLRSLGRWKTRAAVTPEEESSCGAGTLLGTVSVIAGGTATLTSATLPLGANVITAIYLGNGTLAVSTSNAVTVTITAPVTTVTTLMISPSPGAAGQTLTLTATVAPVPTGTPLGTISFCDAGSGSSVVHPMDSGKLAGSTRAASSVHPDGGGGGGNPCGVSTLLQTVTITAQGTVTITTATLTVGDHDIYAVYSGNPGFITSASTPVDETVNTAYTVTAPQTPFTVSEGGSVQITVTVPPLGGSYTNVVTLTATGLPPRATATFNPPTVTPGAEGAQTVMTIQLATAGAAEKPGPVPSVPSPPARPMWPAAGVGLLSIVLIMIAMMGAMLRRRPLPRLAAVASSIVAIAAAALVMASCNGGFAGLSTPAGQYTITITGTSGTLHPSTTVTVVVQ